MNWKRVIGVLLLIVGILIALSSIIVCQYQCIGNCNPDMGKYSGPCLWIVIGFGFVLCVVGILLMRIRHKIKISK